MLRSFVLVVCVAISGVASAVPKLLIAQVPLSFKGEDDPNRPLANLLASEFDENGKLEAIVFSLTDPKFRDLAMSGKLGQVPDVPTRDKALEFAKPLGAEYVAIIGCQVSDGRYLGKLELFRNGKSIWKDDQNIEVQTSGLATNDSLRSLARTLTLRMSAEPLKSLDAPIITGPVKPDEGQAPVEIAITPPPPKRDNSGLIKEANQILASGKTTQAIAMLRDAVDVSPLDPDLRIALVGALGLYAPDMAALEAHNASLLMPEVVELRAMAARAWLRAGQPDNAQAELNEAIARDPNALPTRLLMAEIGIAQLKPEKALEQLDFVITKGDGPEPRFLRALTYALAGKSAEMKADMDLASGNLQGHYDFSTEVLDRGMQLDANQIRALLQRVVVKPDDKAAVEKVSDLQRAYQARAAFCEMLPIPPMFKPAHEQRLLALRLMVQTLSDLQSFMAGGGEEALSDARIDLAEALRNASESKAAETQIRQKA